MAIIIREISNDNGKCDTTLASGVHWILNSNLTINGNIIFKKEVDQDNKQEPLKVFKEERNLLIAQDLYISDNSILEVKGNLHVGGYMTYEGDKGENPKAYKDHRLIMHKNITFGKKSDN